MVDTSVAGKSRKSKKSDEKSDVTTFTWIIEKYMEKRRKSFNHALNSPSFHITNDPDMK